MGWIVLEDACEPGTIPNHRQLVETPSDIFKSLEDAPESAFIADGRMTDCPYRGHAVCTIHVERRLGKSTAASSVAGRSLAEFSPTHLVLKVGCVVKLSWHDRALVRWNPASAHVLRHNPEQSIQLW